MMYEAYNPKDRQITSRNQAVAWLLCVLLIGSVALFDTFAMKKETGHYVAGTEAAAQICG